MKSPVFAVLPIPSSRDSASIVIRLNGTEVEIHSGTDAVTVGGLAGADL